MNKYFVECLLKGYADVNIEDLDTADLYEVNPVESVGDDYIDGEVYDVVCKYGFYINAETSDEALSSAYEEFNMLLENEKINCGDIKGISLADSEDNSDVFKIYDESEEKGAEYRMFLEVKPDERNILIYDEGTWFFVDCMPAGKYGDISLYQPGDTEEESILKTLQALKESICSQKALSPQEYIDAMNPDILDETEIEDFALKSINEIRRIRPYDTYKTKWFEVKL